MADTSLVPTLSKKHDKKLKNREQRCYDSNGYRLRVEAVCFNNPSKEEVILVSSRNSKGCWTIPGGGVDDPDETDETAVIREAKEEAGVNGAIDLCLGTFYDDDKMTRTVAFSVIVSSMDEQWKDNSDDTFRRERKWFSVSEAVEILKNRGKSSKIVYFDKAGCTVTHLADNNVRGVKTLITTNGVHQT